jgi:hypothetical protein
MLDDESDSPYASAWSGLSPFNLRLVSEPTIVGRVDTRSQFLLARSSLLASTCWNRFFIQRRRNLRISVKSNEIPPRWIRERRHLVGRRQLQASEPHDDDDRCTKARKYWHKRSWSRWHKKSGRGTLSQSEIFVVVDTPRSTSLKLSTHA